MEDVCAKFREALRLHPKKAKSHFDIVDPGVWRYGRKSQLTGLGSDWVGPFEFAVDGIVYEAFGLKKRWQTSALAFLEDWGLDDTDVKGADIEGSVPLQKELSVQPKVALVLSVAVASAVICGWMFFQAERETDVVNTAAASSSEGDEEFNKMFARVEKRRIEHEERKRAALCGRSQGRKQGKPTITRHSQSETPAVANYDSIRERARAAFLASKWKEALDIVDQLTEEECDQDLMYYIGICYKEGWGIEHDFAEAYYWFQKSANRHHAGSQYELGLAYEKGNGVAQNYGEAIKWYRIAASRGNAPANLALGILYDEGKGVRMNSAEAAKFYRRGSEFGNAHAGYLLGQLYEKGRGVSKDLSEAAQCYKKAGSAGHALAGYLLGSMYEQGRGVQQSKAEALYWYEKSGKLGNSAAQSAWQLLNGTKKQ